MCPTISVIYKKILFVFLKEFEDSRAAEDAVREMDNRSFDGSVVACQIARGGKRGPGRGYKFKKFSYSFDFLALIFYLKPTSKKW